MPGVVPHVRGWNQETQTKPKLAKTKARSRPTEEEKRGFAGVHGGGVQCRVCTSNMKGVQERGPVSPPQPPSPPEGGDSPCRTCPKPVDVLKRANSRTARPQGPRPASLARSASLPRRSVGADRRGPPGPGRMLPRRVRPAPRRDGSHGTAPSGSEARAATWTAPTVAKFRCVGRSGRRARARSRPTGS
jgi:hypothetical protein